jgi:tRNA nucleotidyltransferase (CCA-adding enzyme)
MREIELHPPREVSDIAATLEDAGFETWCVGGAVRDALLGEPNLDWDLATAATPDEVRRLFRRTVPKGIEFGTVGVLDRRGQLHEVTTFRRDIRTDGRHAEVEFGASLDDDLARRDFTINAIAYSSTRHILHDPFNGRGDLDRRVLRAVGDPDQRMLEDRLRALRAIRFASRFDFEIDPATWDAIVRSAPYLKRLSMERVQQELLKTMEQVRRPSVALERWRTSGAFRVLVPILDTQPAVAFRTLDCLPLGTDSRSEGRRAARTSNRLTALFMGPAAAPVKSAVRELKLSNSQVSWISYMAERWERLAETIEIQLVSDDHVDAGQVRRWASDIGRTYASAFFRMLAARWAAKRSQNERTVTANGARRAYRGLVRSAFREPIEVGDLAVDGEDLRDAGIPPGPLLGKILRELLEAVVRDPTNNDRERLLSMARERAGGPR